MITDYAKKAEELHDAYTSTMGLVAQLAMAEVIIPFCERHQVKFFVGNGTFIFTREDGSGSGYHEDYDVGWRGGSGEGEADEAAPEGFQEVLDTCNTTVPDNDGYGLFLFMEDYTPEALR